jgi:uncharacterized membrane protein (DUF2068 family)
MRRSGWATGVTVAELLLGLALSGTSLYLLWVIREIKRAGGPVEAILGIKIAIWLIASFALLTLVGSYGLWKCKHWGWWLAFLTDLAWAAICVSSVIDDGWHNIDLEMVFFSVLPLAAIVFLLLPAVRKFYWAGGYSQVVLDRSPAQPMVNTGTHS